MRSIMIIAAVMALAAGSASAAAKQCRDSHGKFTKCPAPAAQQCRDAKGHFAKCGTPGAKPVKH